MVLGNRASCLMQPDTNASAERYIIGVTKAIRRQINKGFGDSVRVTIIER